MSPEGEVVSFSFKLVFDCTNNVAEYSALLIGLELAIYNSFCETKELLSQRTIVPDFSTDSPFLLDFVITS